MNKVHTDQGWSFLSLIKEITNPSQFTIHDAFIRRRLYVRIQPQSQSPSPTRRRTVIPYNAPPTLTLSNVFLTKTNYVKQRLFLPIYLSMLWINQSIYLSNYIIYLSIYQRRSMEPSSGQVDYCNQGNRQKGPGKPRQGGREGLLIRYLPIHSIYLRLIV